MKRKEFLSSLGFIAGGMVLGARETSATPMESLRETLKIVKDDESFWKIIREQFIFPKDFSYLNTGGIGAVPEVVLGKVKTGLNQMEIYPSPGHDMEKWWEVKEKCAALLSPECEKEHLALTNTATEGINIVLNGLPLEKGNEVITSTHEHPALHVPLLNMMKRKGIVIKSFEPDLKEGMGNVERINQLISRKTKLIFISHVTCTTGQVFPLGAIGKLARDKGILFASDGAQAPVNVPVDLIRDKVDYYAFSCHKWMLAPKRTGVLYVRPETMDILSPTTVGGYSDAGYDFQAQSLKFQPSAQRYEYGTQNEALYWGMDAAMDFITAIGLENIWEHNKKLADRFYNGLQEIENINILSPVEEKYRSSMISFTIDGHDYKDIANYLMEESIRVRTVGEAGLNAIRVSFHVYNNKEDVDRILEELKNYLN